MFRNILISIVSLIKGKAMLDTSRINEYISVFQTGYVNFFLYEKGNVRICFDTGFGRRRIRKEIKRMNIVPAAVQAVFITHSDFDHIGGLSVFTSAPVYIAEAELAMIRSGRKRLFGMTRKETFAPVMVPLEDDRTVKIGDIMVRAILTPGHTDGSMCFLVDDRFLFAGDACRIAGNRIRPLPEWLNTDHRRHLASVEAIKSLKNAEMVFTGHSGYRK
ncbi:MAG: MBL fold metallo-hydrolase [Spirochaetales bacterium]|nr:MBL fold metallo-hydrolase [Spirochaetales bacterium]